MLLGAILYLVITCREPLAEGWRRLTRISQETSDTEAVEPEAETVQDSQTAAPEEDAQSVQNTEEMREFETVDEDYFADALFIGDSRGVGLYDYAHLDNAEFYVSSGMSIYKLFEDPDRRLKDGNWPRNLATALTEKQYGKIYLMLGINEMGVGDVDYFIENYEAVVEQIRQLQPDALIFIHGLLRVTEERSEKGDYITNEGINERNARLAELADGSRIFYLDVNDLFCDETGALNPEYTHDGVHLYAQYIGIWKQYLLEHGINPK
jgi:hypothetical protein